MRAVVPAAGRGTRLGSLTAERPKGLVDVAGHPLLAHVFSRIESTGLDQVIVIVGYRGGQIVEQFGDRYGPLSLTYVEQPEQRGLADALTHASSHIDDPFLLFNGDNVFLDPLIRLLDHARTSSADGTLLVEAAAPHRARSTGVVSVQEGIVVDIEEKPTSPEASLITTGCAVLPSTVLDACSQISAGETGERELAAAISNRITEGDRFDIIRYNGWRRNVNRPADIRAVERELAHRAGSGS